MKNSFLTLGILFLVACGGGESGGSSAEPAAEPTPEPGATLTSATVTVPGAGTFACGTPKCIAIDARVGINYYWGWWADASIYKSDPSIYAEHVGGVSQAAYAQLQRSDGSLYAVSFSVTSATYYENDADRMSYQGYGKRPGILYPGGVTRVYDHHHWWDIPMNGVLVVGFPEAKDLADGNVTTTSTGSVNIEGVGTFPCAEGAKSCLGLDLRDMANAKGYTSGGVNMVKVVQRPDAVAFDIAGDNPLGSIAYVPFSWQGTSYPLQAIFDLIPACNPDSRGLCTTVRSYVFNLLPDGYSDLPRYGLALGAKGTPDGDALVTAFTSVDDAGVYRVDLY